MLPHEGEGTDGIFHLLDGDEASNKGVPEKDVVRLMGGAEEEESVGGLTNIEVGGEEKTEEV